MIISFTTEFLRKINTPNYPMKGFWAQLGNKVEGKLLIEQWIQNSTELITCNSFLTSTGFRFSLDIINSNNLSNKTAYIYLFAIDLNLYSNIEKDFSGPKDPNLFGQLAALIDLEIDKVVNPINKLVTNIFNVDYPIKCSFNLVSDTTQPQVDHYNSSNIGTSNYYDANTVDGQLLDKKSALDRLKETLTYNRPNELMGSMTIRKNGLIQL